MGRIKIILVSGTRPNFIKIAPLLREIKKEGIFNPLLVHTGQHHDYEMNEVFFQDLKIPVPDYFLAAVSQSPSRQIADIMTRFEKVCLKESPNLVVVVGDVNSTLACSITAKRLGIEIAHVEAGLRSFDMTMPEEINRIVTDSIADYFFITEGSGYKNLLKEGKDKKRLFLVGNVMIDSLFYGLEELKKSDSGVFKTDRLKHNLREYACLTLHRPSNVDDKKRLSLIMGYLGRVSEKIPVIFPVHPRTKKNLKRFGIKTMKNIIFTQPLSYLEFLNLWKDSKMVLTDSGGLQEESTVLKIPCITLRENTERPITITEGTNILVGRDYKKLLKEVDKILKGRGKRGVIPEFWDGKTSYRIIRILKKIYNK